MTETGESNYASQSAGGAVCGVPAHGQPVCVAVFGGLGSLQAEDGAVTAGLGARWTVVSFPLPGLLATFLWHAVAAGSLLFNELSSRRWFPIALYLAGSLPSSGCSALLPPAPGGLTALLSDRRHGGLKPRRTKPGLLDTTGPASRAVAPRGRI